MPHKVRDKEKNKKNIFLSIFQHKIVIAGNHELSFDPVTIDECRFYMGQVGEKENLNKAINCSVKRSAPF